MGFSVSPEADQKISNSLLNIPTILTLENPFQCMIYYDMGQCKTHRDMSWPCLCYITDTPGNLCEIDVNTPSAGPLFIWRYPFLMALCCNCNHEFYLFNGNMNFWLGVTVIYSYFDIRFF